jgi:hypothetical protein
MATANYDGYGDIAQWVQWRWWGRGRFRYPDGNIHGNFDRNIFRVRCPIVRHNYRFNERGYAQVGEGRRTHR